MARDRFVLVKGRFGMGNRIAVMLSALRYARASRRELIVDWNDFTYFRPGMTDVYTSLFEQPSVSHMHLSELESMSTYPSVWEGRLTDYTGDVESEIMPYELSWSKPPDEIDSDSEFSAAEAGVVVLTRDGTKARFENLYSELQPHARIRERVDAFAEGLPWSNMIGVQIRHGNGEAYLTPARTSWFHERIERLRDTYGDLGIFLSTDSPDVVAEFLNRYGDVSYTDKWSQRAGSGPMHHHPDCPDRYESGADALVDIWTLSRCSHLLLCDGGFGRTARHLSSAGSGHTEFYPDKIYATVAEKKGWANPI